MNTATGNRITSIDFLRGSIMIIMALDHVRDYLYSGSFYFDPLDLSKTSGILFFTRWITHFCMPIFMFLAGTSAYLIGQKKSKFELSVFLIKRGLWLVFLELIVLNFGWNFNIAFPMFFFITIWAIGIAMIVLAGLIHVKPKYIISICLIIIFGHNLLDGIHFTGNNLSAFGWAILHTQQVFFWHNETLLIGYPLIPLIAIMPLGYCLGLWYANGYAIEKRQKNLLIIGAAALILFVLIRFINVYGDQSKWGTQKDAFFTFLSFLNVSKYPPSLLYLLLTLGTACIFLSVTEKLKGGIVNIISVYGRVPMFYYLIHIYLIHIIAMVASALTQGQDWQVWFLNKPIWFSKNLKGYGFSLPVAYLIWAGIVVSLYPLCKWYDAYKQANKNKWWLSYL